MPVEQLAYLGFSMEKLQVAFQAIVSKSQILGHLSSQGICWQYLKLDNLIIMILTIASILCLKLFYSSANADDLLWILFPTTKLVMWFSSINFIFDLKKGYVAIDLPIVIGPGCAGLNFFVIALCMSVFTFIGHISRYKLYWFLSLAVTAFLLTVFVNAFRILGGLLLLRVSEEVNMVNPELLHSAQGSLFYFFFLVLYFSVLRVILNRQRRS